MDQTSDAEVDKNVKLIEINNLNTVVFIGKTSFNFVFISCHTVAKKLHLYIVF